MDNTNSKPKTRRNLKHLYLKQPSYIMATAGDTLLRDDFNRALEHAKKSLSDDPTSIRFIRSLTSNQKRKVNRSQQNRINHLAQLGVINLYMNKTYDLSRLGRKLIYNLD
jgi:hypothetical protein